MAVIMMAYVVLVVISSFLDPVGAKFRENTRLALHLFIIAFVVTTTLVSYEKVLPKTKAEQSQAKSTVTAVRQFKVALPYIDRTLEKHVGVGRMRDTLLYFSTIVESTSRGEAVLKAKEIALSDKRGSIRPFNPSQKRTAPMIQVMSDQAIVEQIADASPSASG